MLDSGADWPERWTANTEARLDRHRNKSPPRFGDSFRPVLQGSFLDQFWTNRGWEPGGIGPNRRGPERPEKRHLSGTYGIFMVCQKSSFWPFHREMTATMARSLNSRPKAVAVSK